MRAVTSGSQHTGSVPHRWCRAVATGALVRGAVGDAGAWLHISRRWWKDAVDRKSREVGARKSVPRFLALAEVEATHS
jgi:hypothetical protein